MKRRGRAQDDGQREQLARLKNRAARERRARMEAEAIAEQATRDLYFTVEQLEQANEELRRALEVRDRIVSATAEQLVLPMASVTQLSSALERRWEEITDRNRRMYVGMINEQSSRASRYVQDLVVLSRVGVDGHEPDLGAVRLSTLLQDLIDQTLPVDLERTLTCPQELAVRADLGHLRRILTILLLNAATHGKPPIEVSASRQDRRGVIEVRDHGEGITPAHEERLFEPFTAAETLDPGDEPRAGIGLAIARHLTEVQGGRLSFHRADPGSTFRLHLPLA